MCKKSSDIDRTDLITEEHGYESTFIVMANDTLWYAEEIVAHLDNDSISILANKKAKIGVDELSFKFCLKDVVSNKKISSVNSYFETIIDGDIITDNFYQYDSLEVNYIYINEFLPDSGIVRGEFHLLLNRDKHSTSSLELIEFNDGIFDVRYK